MKNKKFQVFVSSTYEDLKLERQAAVEAILSSGNIPAGMELFSAGDESQMTVIKRWIDESDIFLLILGGRYGSIEPNSGKSYIQLEYEYALEKGIPLFTIVISDSALEKKVQSDGILVIESENQKKLNKFKELVKSKLVKFWDDEKDIKLSIFDTLSEFTATRKLVGWIKGDNEVNSGALAEEIARLTKENSELRKNLNANNNSILYNNLTFEQLKRLLENETVKADGLNFNLYSFLRHIGYKFVNKVWLSPKESDAANQLEIFAIVKVLGQTGNGAKFGFTSEGHKFYLQTLVEERLN